MRDAPGPKLKNYITPAGLQRLKDEHRFLLSRERPAVTKVVAWAASNGDRSENADYLYAKRRLRQIDSRIRFLTKRIDAAEVVDAPVALPEVWLKGSTHVHARPSGDSSTPIAEVIKWYEDRRYDFIVLTDHNQISEVSKDASPTVGQVAIHAPATGLLVLAAFAISWLSVALGMSAKSVETASNTPMFLVLLPFLSSGFVPTESVAPGLSWFAEHQPFTPIIETVRGLLLGTPIGTSGVLAVGWCIVISLVGYLWARRLYDRNPVS